MDILSLCCQFHLKCFRLLLIRNLTREEQIIIKIMLTKLVENQFQALLLFHKVNKVPEQCTWNFE